LIVEGCDKNKKDWEIGGLDDWEIGGLDDWTIG